MTYPRVVLMIFFHNVDPKLVVFNKVTPFSSTSGSRAKLDRSRFNFEQPCGLPALSQVNVVAPRRKKEYITPQNFRGTGKGVASNHAKCLNKSSPYSHISLPTF